jgi:hypothetical protein
MAEDQESRARIVPVWRAELTEFFEKALFCEPSTACLFNQYRDVNSEFDIDRPGAAAIRRDNLSKYLLSITDWPRVVLIGEAPGYRGCRFSGVPFTSEAQLISGYPFTGGQRSSSRAHPYDERAAAQFWGVVTGFESRILAWNCVPFHPHEKGNPLTNRTPTREEAGRYVHILGGVIKTVMPACVVAIGDVAARALSELVVVRAANEDARPLVGIALTRVPYPRGAGRAEFQAGIRRILSKYADGSESFAEWVARLPPGTKLHVTFPPR